MPEPDIHFVIKCVRSADDIIRRGIVSAKSFRQKKSEADVVTAVDVEVQEHLIQIIEKEFPGHKFLAEEGVENEDDLMLGDDPTWIIDPIDGTTNFLHGFPNFGVSIAFVEDGIIKIGVVSNPMNNEIWYATSSGPAFYINGECPPITISTSDRKKIGESLVSTGYNAARCREDLSNSPEKMEERERLVSVLLENHKTMMMECRDLRRIGATATDLCYVAMGKLDAYYELGPKEWDLAAGTLILLKAKGVVGTHDGKIFTNSGIGAVEFLHGRQVLAASSKELFTAMSSKLRFYDWWNKS